MGKWLKVEALLLAVILVAAVVACVGISNGSFVPAMSDALGSTPPDETQNTTQQTTLPETTEAEPTWMTFPADRVLTAQQAFVYDCQSDTFSYLMGNQNDKVYPASITKLFTAYVALQFLEPEDLITAGDALELVGVGSSIAEIEEGNVLSVEMLVEAMLLPSGNDAAYILAAEAGRKLKEDTSISASAAVSAFLKEMNGQARALGMSGTHFTNPDGYHDYDHYTTYADLVTIGNLALKNETIMKHAAVSSDNAVFESGQTKKWKNTNSLVDPKSEYYCPYATGLKTGQTPSAGSCLLSSFDAEGRQYLIGVFGCPEIEDRFEDTLQLLNETLGITE